MNSVFLSALVLAGTTLAALAEAPATNSPPGAVQEPDRATSVQLTSAPQQANAKSAPGAQAPDGTNGKNQNGVSVTKGPTTGKKRSRHGAEQSAPTATASAPAPAKNPEPSKPSSRPTLDSYLADLNDALKLSAEEKQAIRTYYLADGTELQGILNNDALSPLQQDRQVADLREKRNAKIEALLDDQDRRRDFFKVEAKYRVALVELAADGGMLPAQPLAPVPAPTDTPPGGASSSPTPKANENETSVGGAAKSS